MVKQRPKGAGLGNIDEKTEQQKFEEFRQKARQEQIKKLEEGSDESEEEDDSQPKSWKKGAAPRRKPKTVYEILNQEEESKPQIVVGILLIQNNTRKKPIGQLNLTRTDMRGPQVKILSSAADAAEVKKKAGPLPELRFNVRLLVDLAEVKVQNADRKMKQEKDNLNLLTNEKTRVEEQVTIEAKSIFSTIFAFIFVHILISLIF